MLGGDQAVAEIRPKSSECTHCLGITWNAQATTGTFCNDYGRCASPRIFCVSIATKLRLICAFSIFRLRYERGLTWNAASCAGRAGVAAIRGWFPRSALNRSRFLSSPNVFPIPHRPKCHPGLVDVVPRIRRKPRVAPSPRNLVTAAGR